MQKITPFLWFNDQAEDAAKFYTSVFPNSSIDKVTRYSEAASEASGQPTERVMTIGFTLDGQKFTALNGGPHVTFNEAISFVVDCETQKEVDELWGKLTDGGEEGRCAWLKDRYGVSWQIVPRALVEMLSDPDAEKSRRIMEAMLEMNKIDIGALKRAYESA